MDMARSLTSIRAIGSLDSESAQGAAMPSMREASPETPRSPPTFSSRPCSPRSGTRAAAQALDDVSLGDGIEAERAIAQPLDRVQAGPTRHAGWVEALALAAASSAASGTRPLAAARDQRRETSTLGSKACAAVSPGVACREHFEEFRRDAHRSSGSGLPPADSLARSYPLKIKSADRSRREPAPRPVVPIAGRRPEPATRARYP